MSAAHTVNACVHRSIDRQVPQEIREDLVPRRGLCRPRLRPQRGDAHLPHQPLHPLAVDPPHSPARAAPPRRSSPSAPHPAFVSFSSSSSAPSVMTERPRFQLVSRSQIRGPLRLATDFPEHRAAALAWNNSALFLGISVGAVVRDTIFGAGGFAAVIIASAAGPLAGMRLLFEKNTPQQESVDANEVIREMIVLLRCEPTRYSISVRTEPAKRAFCTCGALRRYARSERSAFAAVVPALWKVVSHVFSASPERGRAMR